MRISGGAYGVGSGAGIEKSRADTDSSCSIALSRPASPLEEVDTFLIPVFARQLCDEACDQGYRRCRHRDPPFMTLMNGPPQSTRLSRPAAL